jgi:hypothetical protein
MEPQHWARIESLYHAALEKEPDERSRYLAHACADDPDLRHEVETLLGYAGTELKSPTADAFLSELRQKDPELHDQVQRLLRAREDTVTIPAGANGVSQLNRNPGVTPPEHAAQNHHNQSRGIMGPVCFHLALLKQGELFAQIEVLGCQCAARPRSEHKEADEIVGDG